MVSGTGAGWKDTDLPPSVDYPADSRWGIGDAFIASGIYFFSSIALFLIAVLVFDADVLGSWWFPVTLITPQLLQFSFVWWTARARGNGLAFDFGFSFRWRDLAVGAMLLVISNESVPLIGHGGKTIVPKTDANGLLMSVKWLLSGMPTKPQSAKLMVPLWPGYSFISRLMSVLTGTSTRRPTSPDS